MLGSLGWRLFVAAMLIAGIFAVLQPEGEGVSVNDNEDVMAMVEVSPSAIVAVNVQVDNPVSYEVAHISAMELTVDHISLDFAERPIANGFIRSVHRYPQIRNMKNRYAVDATAATAATADATNRDGWYPMLCFQGTLGYGPRL